MDKRIWIVFFIMFLNLLGVGIILPLLPYYAEHFHATPLFIGFLASTYPFFQLISAPILGNLSDKFGRRPILLFSLFGTVLGFVTLGFANSLPLLFFARFIDGASAGNIPAAYAYISDVTDGITRAKALSMIKASFGLGFVIGPALGGILSQYGNGVPGFVGAGISLLALLLVYFFLPEPAHKEKAHAAFKLSALFHHNHFKIKKVIWILLILSFLLDMTLWSIYVTFPLFAEHALHMTSVQIGYVFTLFEIVGVIVQLGLLQKLLQIFSEERLLLSGFCILVVGALLLFFAQNVVFLIGVLIIMWFGMAIITPIMPAIASKKTSQEEQGHVMGLLSASSSIGTLVAPIVGLLIYSVSIRGQFVLASAFAIVAFFLSFYFWKK